MPISSKLEALRTVLICPECRAPLQFDVRNSPARPAAPPTRLNPASPNYFAPSRRAAVEAALSGFQGPHAELRRNRFFQALIPPNAVYDPGRRARETRVKAALSAGVVLNLGSKATSWGEHVINVDIALPFCAKEQDGTPACSLLCDEDEARSKLEYQFAPWHPVDLLAELERLPFADNSVDGIVCSYVLEHVSDAQICIGEMLRVLKPGGLLYVSVPFLFPTHPDPLDRWRWTFDGLRYSLRACEEIEAGGACGGAFSAFAANFPVAARLHLFELRAL